MNQVGMLRLLRSQLDFFTALNPHLCICAALLIKDHQIGQQIRSANS